MKRMTADERRLANLRRRVSRARQFPFNTCPSSRHLHTMADVLAKGHKYHMFDEEPEHCAETFLNVLLDLWTRRAKDKAYMEKNRALWERSKP